MCDCSPVPDTLLVTGVYILFIFIQMPIFVGIILGYVENHLTAKRQRLEHDVSHRRPHSRYGVGRVVHIHQGAS